MKYLICTFFIFISNYIICQVNVDSIKLYLLQSDNYYKVETTNITQGFKRYSNKNDLESFDICIDSLNNLNEYINVSVIHKVFDSNGRLLKRIGYDRKGGYALYDFSPILIKSYQRDTIIEEYYNSKEEQTSKKTTILDSLKREIEVIWYKEGNMFESRTKYEYSDANNRLYIKYISENGNLNPNSYGVSILLKQFDSKNSENVIEEWFYDSKMKLVDADHNNLIPENNSLKYAHIKTVVEEGITYKYFYNSNGDLICESDGLFISN